MAFQCLPGYNAIDDLDSGADIHLPPPLRHGSLYHCRRCNNFDRYRLIIGHPQFCERKGVDLLVLVKSRVGGSRRRGIIRDTWAKETMIKVNKRNRRFYLPISHGYCGCGTK